MANARSVSREKSKADAWKSPATSSMSKKVTSDLIRCVVTRGTLLHCEESMTPVAYGTTRIPASLMDFRAAGLKVTELSKVGGLTTYKVQA